MSSISLYAKMDLSDVWDEISDAQLREEMERRCIEAARTVAEAKENALIPLVEEAPSLLQSGRADDAALALERALFPKWKSPEDALKQLRAVTA
jgi:hypothetical protein